jgi:hypothetical protein
MPGTISVAQLGRLVGMAPFRFKLGVIRTRLACSLAGVVLQLAFGSAL